MSENLPINTVTVLTTNTCTAACAHCCMNSGPKRRGQLSLDTINTALEELVEFTNLKVVVFAGGEPTLLKGRLLGAIEKAKSLGLSTRLVTNASWAVNSEMAHEKLAQLKSSGLDELNISADDFHLPFIPFERVKTLWNAAKDYDFLSVVIANSSGSDSLVTPDWIMQELGEQLPMRYDADGEGLPMQPVPGQTYYGLSNGMIQKLRANWDQHVDQSIRSGGDKVKHHCPFAGRQIALTPDGQFAACCGYEFDEGNPLRLGSIKKNDVERTLRRAYDDVILNAVAEIGPYFLTKFVNEVAPEIKFKDDYCSLCEVCFEATARPDSRKAIIDNLPRLAGYVNYYLNEMEQRKLV